METCASSYLRSICLTSPRISSPASGELARSDHSSFVEMRSGAGWLTCICANRFAMSAWPPICCCSIIICCASGGRIAHGCCCTIGGRGTDCAYICCCGSNEEKEGGRSDDGVSTARICARRDWCDGRPRWTTGGCVQTSERRRQRVQGACLEHLTLAARHAAHGRCSAGCACLSLEAGALEAGLSPPRSSSLRSLCASSSDDTSSSSSIMPSAVEEAMEGGASATAG
mmetsp:Transcript_25623/g.63396  ORF Transcript_25623/g.63396 Transcript_25623/m.63396 type:complete len:228 (-) Transcript_25623:375-1058(-)